MELFETININEIDVKQLFQEQIIKINGKLIEIDINELIEYDSKIYDFFLLNPEKFIYLVKKESELYNLNNPLIRFLNWKEEQDISKIRVKDLGNIVKFDGMISKITEPLVIIISKTFSCPACGTTVTTKGDDVKKCSCGFKGRFTLESQELEDIQEMILEELQEKTEGKQPQKIRVRLNNKLTGKQFAQLLRPGNRVSVIGIIDKIPLKNKQEEEMFQYRIIATQVMDLEEKYDDTIQEEDIKEIEELSLDNPLEKLRDSLAPNIWGRNDLKTILLLQMVGGVQKTMWDGKLTRHFTHILVIGSPSTSKSELAKNVHIRCPKSFYSSGDNASAAGLVGAVVKDELLGSWAIDVGPMIKASGSLFCCDELDKFPKDQLKALHTPLESGYAQITKAGLDGKFPAETSLLGLANPKHGVFEEDKPIVDQINLPPALLSRFDIIYVLKDEVEKESDDKIAEIIYSQKQKEDIIPKISVQLFRKYITYARKFNPILPEEHLVALQEFYHEVRKKSKSHNSNMKGLPIGTRHLQGIIRLAEASAKIRLSKVVEKEDFELAKKLFYDSLVKIGMDEGGVFDLARISRPGQNLSKRKLMGIVMDTIRQLCVGGQSIGDTDLQKVMEEKGMKYDDYITTMDLLNRECSILKEGNSWKIA